MFTNIFTSSKGKCFVVALSAMIAFGLTNCATTDEQSAENGTNSEESENSNSQAANNQQGNDSGEGENNATENEFNNQQGQQGQGAENFGFQNDGGEGMNNAVETAEDGGGQELNLGNDAMMANGGEEPLDETTNSAEEVPANNAASEEVATEEAPANNAALAATNVPANTAMNPAAETSPDATLVGSEEVSADAGLAPLEAAPATGGIVKYVRSDISATNQPGGGQTVKTLETGDHPVVWDEGEFARMSNGTYVPTSSLTTDGIGRPRRDLNWGQ